MNKVVTPVMYLIIRSFVDSPQLTHRWTYKRLAMRDVAHLKLFDSVMVPIKKPPQKGLLARFMSRLTELLPFVESALKHLTVFGGPREYDVIRPLNQSEGEWYVGWVISVPHPRHFKVGVSRLPIHGPVRLLVGSQNHLTFFGIKKSGEQIPIGKIGSGRIGERCMFSKIPLM